MERNTRNRARNLRWLRSGVGEAVEVYWQHERTPGGMGAGKPSVLGPEDVAALCSPMTEYGQEVFRIVCLDVKSHVLAVVNINVGTAAASLVHPRDVMIACLQNAAVSFVCIHNHPSGDSNPSSEDVQFSQRMKKAAELLGLRMVDSIIVAAGDWTSLRARGLL